MNKNANIWDLLKNEKLEQKKIGDICKISRGKVISKNYIYENPGEYPVYSSQTTDNGLIGKINSYMYDGEYLTWTTDGICAGTVFYRHEKFNITTHCGLLKVTDKNVNTKYLYYILKQEALKYSNTAADIPTLGANFMMNIVLPIPSLEIQKRVVNVLDKFSELAENTKGLLPQEIKLRTKQYEYYRDKLLSFGELETHTHTQKTNNKFLFGNSWNSWEITTHYFKQSF